MKSRGGELSNVNSPPVSAQRSGLGLPPRRRSETESRRATAPPADDYRYSVLFKSLPPLAVTPRLQSTSLHNVPRPNDIPRIPWLLVLYTLAASGTRSSRRVVKGRVVSTFALRQRLPVAKGHRRSRVTACREH